MDIEQAVKHLQRVYPDYDITSGYIGNCGRYGDDRSWRIWINDVQVDDVWGRRPFYIRCGSTEEMGSRSHDEWIELLMQGVKRIEGAIHNEHKV